MSTENKIEGKADVAKGKIKEGVGSALNDSSLEAKGKGDQVKGNLKQAGEKVKDAVRGD